VSEALDFCPMVAGHDCARSDHAAIDGRYCLAPRTCAEGERMKTPSPHAWNLARLGKGANVVALLFSVSLALSESRASAQAMPIAVDDV
jgi:hypothetical protein